MADIRSLTLVCTLIACAALVLVHALMARLWLSGNSGASPQKATALLGLVLNVPLVIGLMTWGVMLKTPIGELLLAWVYAALAYNSVAYSYFHFFNLGETGRRIRVLLQLLEGEHIGITDARATTYSGQTMIRQRLARLLQMGQLGTAGGRYTIKGRFLLRAARLVRSIGRLTTGRADVLPGRAL
ncbi:MAG: hypothetical protein V4451_09380 [Pseudomonadota bacterium]